MANHFKPEWSVRHCCETLEETHLRIRRMNKRTCFPFNLMRNIWNIKADLLRVHRVHVQMSDSTMTSFSAEALHQDPSDLISEDQWFTVISIATQLKHTTTRYFLSCRHTHTHTSELNFIRIHTCFIRTLGFCGNTHMRDLFNILTMRLHREQLQSYRRNLKLCSDLPWKVRDLNLNSNISH